MSLLLPYKSTSITSAVRQFTQSPAQEHNDTNRTASAVCRNWCEIGVETP
uniref:Uncharacterized protein n=1 Tax=Anguilla anguilla TaxID=7936 RepID=A0A0E9PRD9_ANGAN